MLLNDNTITSDQTKILHEQYKFYKQLYTSNPLVKFTYQNEYDVKIDESESKSLDEEFTIEEFGLALKSMANNKTPGCDGIPCEIYKVFWEKLKLPFFEAIQVAKKEGTLHMSARRGVICLIPKKR